LDATGLAGADALGAVDHLPLHWRGANVPAMYPIARLLQFVALVIPPLAIVAQLNQSISTGEMLKFLVVSVGIFLAGYLLQRYSGGSAA
jgi:hypothetical protein